jgi:hypothetical protein
MDRAESEQNRSLQSAAFIYKESNSHNPVVTARCFRQLREDRRRTGGAGKRENGRDRNNVRLTRMTSLRADEVIE